MVIKKRFLGFTKPKSGEVQGDRVLFDGWSVDIKDGVCFLEYIKAEQGGGLEKVEISYDDYRLVKEKSVGWDYMNRKYIK